MDATFLQPLRANIVQVVNNYLGLRNHSWSAELDLLSFERCGGGEIRTHDPVSQIPLFKSGAFNLSSHSSKSL